jgi:hypothetical protein
MLEKIDSYLAELSGLYEAYKEQKPWFRKKNGDVLLELQENKKKLTKIRGNIQSYDNASFWGKLWINWLYPIGYYKELIQYYELNELTQQAISMSTKERVLFINDIANFLGKFSVENIKDTILRIYNGLLDIKKKYFGGFEGAGDNGLPLLNDHIPNEDQSDKALIKTLNTIPNEIIAGHDKHSKIFEELLPKQAEEVEILSRKIKAHSKFVDTLTQKNAQQDADIGNLEKMANRQHEELCKLKEESDLQSAQLKKQVSEGNELDRKIQLLIERQVAEIMGETSQTKETNNDKTSTSGAFFERKNATEKNKKFDKTNSDKKESSLG